MSDEQIDVVAELPAEIEVTSDAPAVVDVLDAAPASIDVVASPSLVEAAASGAVVDLVAGVPAEIEAVDDAPALIAVITGVPGPPGAPGAGGGGIDYVQQADPGAVGAFKTWLQLPPARNPDAWLGSTTYLNGQRVQPTVPNGHYYHANNAGQADVVEPVWPTDGSTVVDNTITWQDFGLLGTVLPIEYQLWVRKSDNSGWYRSGINSRVNETADWETFDIAGITRTLISQKPDGSLAISSYDAGGNQQATLTFDTGGAISVTAAATTWDTLDGRVDFNGRDLIAGSVDPSAGAGISTSFMGSIYQRDTGTVGELWVKTGAAPTAWTKVV